MFVFVVLGLQRIQFDETIKTDFRSTYKVKLHFICKSEISVTRSYFDLVSPATLYNCYDVRMSSATNNTIHNLLFSLSLSHLSASVSFSVRIEF